MNDFIELASVQGMVDGTMTQVDADGHQFLVAKVKGRFYVTDARCPHLHGHLARGVLEGTILTCPVHHSQFDIADGHVVRWTDFQGAVKTVADLVRHPRPLRTYASKVEGDVIFVGPENIPPSAA